jgi:hypothetical protein
MSSAHAGFDAVVIGEPQRVFYGNQYSLTMPVFTRYGVQLWVPEVGGAVDPESEAHDLIMSVFIRDAAPAEKTAIYDQLGLKITFKPGQAKIRAEVTIGPEKDVEHTEQSGDTARVRGGT